ncbi:ankyrin repeat domain-containing protein [Alienimonas chondri]|uniref:Ankyrin repeat domain-containing protein n=1 Tax=Alienimonas chondri TaxID=2681879 RepID=A0ABX1VJG5_9PLAN|nr:hypothetical protein [Alienimonas chondri]NNJ28029.1 hypothetical protein [Alienimonas chondri]
MNAARPDPPADRTNTWLGSIRHAVGRTASAMSRVAAPIVWLLAGAGLLLVAGDPQCPWVGPRESPPLTAWLAFSPGASLPRTLREDGLRVNFAGPRRPLAADADRPEFTPPPETLWPLGWGVDAFAHDPWAPGVSQRVVSLRFSGWFLGAFAAAFAAVWWAVAFALKTRPSRRLPRAVASHGRRRRVAARDRGDAADNPGRRGAERAVRVRWPVVGGRGRGARLADRCAAVAAESEDGLMAKQSEAAKLRRRKVANRRGAFDTWGEATWEALLIRPLPGAKTAGEPAADPAEALAACGAVGAVERDATAAVLEGTWVPPAGEWALLVVPKTTGWATLVSTGWAEDLIENRLADFHGETLRTGASDSAGIVTLRHRRHDGGEPQDLVHFRTDGVRWEPDEPDEEGPDDDADAVSVTVQFGPPPGPAEEAAWEQIAAALEGTSLAGTAFPLAAAAAWLDERTSAEDAHQTLLCEADAYVPGLAFVRDGGTGNSGRLCAAYGHEDFLSAEHIARIDVIRFGAVKATPPSEAAGRRLEAAVGRAKVKAVKKALADGATLGVLPNSRHTALWLACEKASTFEATDRAALFEIIGLLLDAGADPNARPVDAASPLEQAIATEFVQTRGPACGVLDVSELIRRLAAAGCDVNAVSQEHSYYRERILHVAATQNRPAFVTLLLELGADPSQEDARGLTPYQALIKMLESNAQRTWAPNHVPLERGLEDHAEVLALLKPVERD